MLIHVIRKKRRGQRYDLENSSTAVYERPRVILLLVFRLWIVELCVVTITVVYVFTIDHSV